MCKIVIGLLLACLCACSSDSIAYYPAKGTVKTKAGKPCDGALVVFHPTEEDRVNDPKPVGTCNAQGEFELLTHSPGDGAREGGYGVTIVWIGKAKQAKMSLSDESSGGKDQLRGKYGNPSSPILSADITQSGPNEFEFIVEL